MRGRFTIIRNQMLLKDNSIGSHLYINIVMLWIFFFQFSKVLCNYISAFKTETGMGFKVIIIVIRVHHLCFTTVK